MFFLISFLVWVICMVLAQYSKDMGKQLKLQGYQNPRLCALWATADTLIAVVGIVAAATSIVGALILIWGMTRKPCNDRQCCPREDDDGLFDDG